MVIEIKPQVCNGHLLKWLVGAGLTWLEQNRDKVNRMNVFPVPDGDTGTNMVLTMRKAYAEIAPLDTDHVGMVSRSMAQGALMGARGNSGVILSQLWDGFARTVEVHEVLDAPLFVRACQTAVEAAYKAVIPPVEGTILTVARQATDAVVEHSERGVDLSALLEIMVEAAHMSLMNTPKLLPVLKEAGVVDSGGMGLFLILEGMYRLLKGELTDVQDDKVSLNGQYWQDALMPEDQQGYGYDVQFLMRGDHLNVAAIREDIHAMGWSTLVVGDARLVKVHVHVHDPGQPISYAIRLGASISDVVVENMQEQYQAYVRERLQREQTTSGAAVITVVSGDGMRRIFEEYDAHVIAGGQTMNPSTEDFLSVIDSLPHDEIILLPNNKNIILAAKQAAALCPQRRIQVIPSRTLPQGINAMVTYANLRENVDFDRLCAAMEESVRQTITGEVTTATRSVNLDGVDVREGQFIGLLDGRLAVTGDGLYAVVSGLLHQGHADEHELITLYYGSDTGNDQIQSLAAALAEEFPRQEIIVVEGGQPLYPYIISVE